MPTRTPESVPQPVAGSRQPTPYGEPTNFPILQDALLLPRVIAMHRELSPGARLLWGVIRVLSYKRGYCGYSDALLGHRVHVSDRQIRRYCRQLAKAGLLRTTQRPGRPPKRELLNHPIFDVPSPVPPGQKGPTPRTDTAMLSDTNVRQHRGTSRSEHVSGSPSVKSQDGGERNQSGLTKASTVMEKVVAQRRRDGAEPVKALSATLTTAADLDQLKAIQREVKAIGLPWTDDLQGKLAHKMDFYKVNGFVVAAAIARAARHVSRTPSSRPQSAAWITTVVENALRDQVRRKG